MRLLTTKEAEQLYGIPADTFAQWCREEKILGASQTSGRWQIPQDAVEQFFNDNPALRPSPLIADNPTWANFGVSATILGFAMDAYSLYNIITGGSRTFIWLTAFGFSTLLWIAALYIHRARQRTKIIGYQNNTPIFEEKPRYTNSILRTASTIVLWSMPLIIVLAFISYQVWRIIPPQQTVILVADFVDPTVIDTRDVTADLVEQMETLLANHANIHIKRLHQAIDRENGDETALTIGQRPEHKAAIVIWGNYVSPPDPELTVHFRMVQPNGTYLSTGYDQRYTPAQINQPTMFEFKIDLGKQLAQLVAFSSGLLLFEADRNKDALPFFDTAATAINTPLGKEFERAIRFYRGTNYLPLGRAREAQVDLQTLVPTDDKTNQVFDKFSLAALGNLGLAYAALGQVKQAIEHSQQALVIAREIGDRRGEGNHLGNLGNAYAALGQVEKAIEHYQQALVIDREIGDRRGEGNHLGNLGNAYAALGQVEKAIEHYQQALVIAREIGDRRGEGNHLGNLGIAYADLGQVEQAVEHYQQALVIDREIGNRRNEGNWLGNLGTAYAALGQVEKAIEHYQQALVIAREIGDRRGEGNHLGNLGNAYAALGQVEKAIEHYQQALVIAREIGDRSGEGNHLGYLGNAYRNLGQMEKAIEHSQQALVIAREIGDRRGEGNHLGNLGLAYADLGQVEQAVEHYQQALVIAREIGDRRNEGNWLGSLGNAYRNLGQMEKAIEHYQQALVIAREIGDRRGEGNHLGNLGNAYADLGQIEKAIEHYQQALVIAREIGDRRNEGNWLGNLGTAYATLGQVEKARELWQESLRILDEIKSPNAEKVREQLRSLTEK